MADTRLNIRDGFFKSTFKLSNGSKFKEHGSGNAAWFAFMIDITKDMQVLKSIDGLFFNIKNTNNRFLVIRVSEQLLNPYYNHHYV